MSANRHHNALAPGYRLHWYEIESVLGQGGFGITYLATDTNLQQSVAIKEFLPSDLAVRTQDSAVHPVSDARADTFGWGLTRFLTEAQTLAQFRHPNIVRVYSVFEANGTAYMVMEYERGASLEDALKFRRIEGERALVSLAHAIMDGLELVHQAGFIHRDIKPDNIFMRDDNGVPVLLDFGSARQAVGVETKTLTSLVTPGYAPFEQYNATRENDRQGPWTDIYSLAATLYRGITGNGPIDAVARADALLSGERDPLLTLAMLEPVGYSPQLIMAIDRALAFQSGDRPQSLAEWRAMLPSRPTTPDFGAAAGSAAAGAERSVTTVSQEDDTVVRNDAQRAVDTRAGETASRATFDADNNGRVERADAAAAMQATTPPVPASTETAATARRAGLSGAGFALLAVSVVALGGWFAWPHLQGNVGVQGDAQPSMSTSSPSSPVAVAEQTPAVGARQENEPAALDPLASEREQLEQERAALAAQREKLELRTQQQAADDAQREVREQVRLLAEQREKLRLERENLQRLRTEQERERVAQSVATPVPSQTASDAAVQPPPTVAEERSAPVQQPTLADDGTTPAATTPAASVPVPTPAATVESAQQLAALLERARADEAALRLTSPPGNNAVERYREVLARDPANADARAGLHSVVGRYLSLTEQALADNGFEKARAYVQRARGVDAGDARIADLAERIAQAQRQFGERETARQLAQAREAQERAEREAARREQAARAQATAQREADELARKQAQAKAEAQAQAQVLAEQQAAEQRAKDSALRQVRLATFPNETLQSCYVPVGSRIEDTASKLARGNSRVELVFSTAAGRFVPSIGHGRRLWQGTAVHKEPKLAAVATAARDVGADAVLMGWYHCNTSPNVTEDTYRAWVYLVDVRTSTVTVRETPLLDTAKGVSELLQALFAARGL